jgi:hypothetical protein
VAQEDIVEEETHEAVVAEEPTKLEKVLHPAVKEGMVETVLYLL